MTRDTNLMRHALQGPQLAAVAAEVQLGQGRPGLLLPADQIDHSIGLQERRHLCTKRSRTACQKPSYDSLARIPPLLYSPDVTAVVGALSELFSRTMPTSGDRQWKWAVKCWPLVATSGSEAYNADLWWPPVEVRRKMLGMHVHVVIDVK